MGSLRSFMGEVRIYGLYVAAVFAAFMIMILVSHLCVRDIVQDQMMQYGKTTMDYAEAHVMLSLSKTDVLLEGIAFTLEGMLAREAGPDEIQAFLTGWTERAEWTKGAFKSTYAYLNGRMFDGLESRKIPPDFEIVERPWYKGALGKNGAIFYADAYLDAGGKETVVTLSKVLYNNNTEKHPPVVALDFSLAKIADLVDGLRFMDHGYGVLLNEDFEFIVHRNPSYIGRKITEAGDRISESYAAISERLTGNSALYAMEFVDLDGTRSVSFFKKLSNGWYVGIIAPSENFYGMVFRMGIILSVLGFLLMALLSYFLLRLYSAKMRSEAASRIKTSFIANMSHEIRTPMNSIMGMSELILREDPGDPTIVEYVWEIKRASANLLDIINDILDISKIEAGRLELVSVEYGLSSMIHDIVSIVKVRIGYKPIDFIVDLSPELPFKLLGDELRVRQMLLNLLGNAVKFTEKGFVKFLINGKRDGEKIRIEFTVADSGIGIQRKDMDKLFKEFSQVDTRKNRSIEGTGLGLAITEKLCSMMNGEIKFTSQYGVGSVFTLTIEQEIADPSPLAKVDDADRHRTIVYEKSPLVAESLASAIRSLGVRCDMYVNRGAFLRQLKKDDCGYDYAFVSENEDKEWLLKRMPPDTTLIWIAEYERIVKEQSLLILRKPVTCIQIGNILNDRTNDPYHKQEAKSGIEFSAPNARVLIVDDNVTNLKVATGLIKGYMIQADTALGGAEALEKIAQNEYDLIFMDHMMSDMDGIETTSEIRRRFGDIPIVALTANAVSGAREFFIERGMNDFLSKPINLKSLNSILKKYIPEQKRQGVVRRTSGETELPHIEIAGVDTVKGLENCGNSLESYLAVLSTFHLDGQEKILALEKLYEARDIGGFVILSHALKSACSQIGADGTARLAAALEAASRRDDVKFIEYNLDIFIASFEKILQSLLPIVYGPLRARQEKPKGSPDFLDDKLSALFKALEMADSGTIDTVLDEIEKYSWERDTAYRLDKIRSLVDVFEYDEALQNLRPPKSRG